MRLGYIVFLAVVGGWTTWYLIDALSVSTNIRNIILIAPLCAIVIACCIFEAGREVLSKTSPTLTLDPAEPPPQSRSDVLRGMALLVLLGALAASYSYIGFDSAIFLFLLSTLYILEPGQHIAKVVFSAIFTGFIVYGARFLLPYPLPTLVL